MSLHCDLRVLVDSEFVYPSHDAELKFTHFKTRELGEKNYVPVTRMKSNVREEAKKSQIQRKQSDNGEFPGLGVGAFRKQHNRSAT